MPDFGGGFDVPEDALVPGSTTILGWSDFVVSINKLPLSQLMSWSCTRAVTMGSGTCTLRLSDPLRELYDLFQPQDEIEIFASEVDDLGTYSAQKIWGGFLDNYSFDVSGGGILNISGKEYAARLQSYVYNNPTLTGTVYSCLQDVLTNQDEFTYDGIPVTLSSAVAMNVQNDTIFNVVRKICDQWKVFWWVDPGTRDIRARYTVDVPTSTDAINESNHVSGDRGNMTKAATVKKNSEKLTNEVIINYNNSSDQPATITDATAQSQWGKYQRIRSVGNISAVGDAQQYGQSLVDNRKIPANNYEISSSLLMNTDPGDYLPIVSPTLGLNGSYQVYTIKHSWEPQKGVTSTVTLESQQLTSNVELADTRERLDILERKSYNAPTI